MVKFLKVLFLAALACAASVVLADVTGIVTPPGGTGGGGSGTVSSAPAGSAAVYSSTGNVVTGANALPAGVTNALGTPFSIGTSLYPAPANVTSVSAAITANSTTFTCAANCTNLFVGATLSGSDTAHFVASLGVITGGTGYNGGGTATFTSVPLTGGTGTGAVATVIVTSGAVSSVTITTTGTGYTAADVLSASAANLGNNGGSGFSVPVASIGNHSLYGALGGEIGVQVTNISGTTTTTNIAANASAVSGTYTIFVGSGNYIDATSTFLSNMVASRNILVGEATQGNSLWPDLYLDGYCTVTTTTACIIMGGNGAGMARGLATAARSSDSSAASIEANTFLAVNNNTTNIGLGTITPGSGYDGGASGTFTGIALTGGTGTGAVATITVTVGAITSVSITTAGSGYAISDTLSAVASSIGSGGGSGFSVPISKIGTGSFWNHYWQTEVMPGAGQSGESFGLESTLFNFGSVTQSDPFTINKVGGTYNLRLDTGQSNQLYTQFDADSAVQIGGIGGFSFENGIIFGSTALDTGTLTHPPAISFPSGANGYSLAWYRAAGYSTPSWLLYSTNTTNNGNFLSLNDAGVNIGTGSTNWLAITTASSTQSASSAAASFLGNRLDAVSSGAVAQFIGEGQNTSAATKAYGQMNVQVVSDTAGSEAGDLGFQVAVSGTETTKMQLFAADLNLFAGVGIYVANGTVWVSGTAPTVTSGLGTSPVVSANTTAAFKITTGATGTPATAVVLGMPAASSDWACQIIDKTTNTITGRQTADTTTSVTFTMILAPNASDVLLVTCGAI